MLDETLLQRHHRSSEKRSDYFHELTEQFMGVNDCVVKKEDKKSGITGGKYGKEIANKKYKFIPMIINILLRLKCLTK